MAKEDLWTISGLNGFKAFKYNYVHLPTPGVGFERDQGVSYYYLANIHYNMGKMPNNKFKKFIPMAV